MLTRRAAICTILATPMLAMPVCADTPLVYAVDGWAIDGFDPVAYFRDRAVIPGSRREVIGWRGAQWCFKSVAHREAFEADPHAYAPRYGGYCALALIHGELTPSDPQAWSITEDQLFLNTSLADRAVWLADPETNIRRADAHWDRLVNA